MLVARRAKRAEIFKKGDFGIRVVDSTTTPARKQGGEEIGFISMCNF